MTAKDIIVPEKKYSESQLDYNCDEQTLRRPFAKPIAKDKHFSSLSLNINSSISNNSRPKLHTVRSSDASRFPTLEKLENSMLLPKNSKITIEPVIFSGESNNHNTSSSIPNCKKLGSQSDAKSIHSFKSTKKKQVKKKYQSPTEIFAKNLSEAVLDVDDSLDDGYVYNNANATFNLYPSPLLSPPLLSSFDTSANYKSGNDEGYFGDHHRQKFRRPGLRSTVSELPARGVRAFYLDTMATPKFEKRSSYYSKSQPQYRYSSSGEEDEENSPLLYYSSSSGSQRRKRGLKQGTTTRKNPHWCKLLTLFSLLFGVTFFLVLIFLASGPLKEVEVLSLNNVLGTRKNLIFDLHVKAKNYNSWSVQISYSAFSVFAASNYVPTDLDKNNTIHGGNKTSLKKFNVIDSTAKQEYLGTVNHLDDPMLFDPAHLFYIKPKSSNSTSQIQIKNPGETKNDSTGNERWSLLIRYPYELTVRGVLKYQIFPAFLASKVYSARICRMVRVDPATGAVDEVLTHGQSICEEP